MVRTPSIATLLSIIVLAGFTWFATPVDAEEAAFGGIGLQVVPTVEGDLVVLNVLDDAPAAEKPATPPKAAEDKPATPPMPAAEKPESAGSASEG